LVFSEWQSAHRRVRMGEMVSMKSAAVACCALNAATNVNSQLNLISGLEPIDLSPNDKPMDKYRLAQLQKSSSAGCLQQGMHFWKKISARYLKVTLFG
jgi:hypothetical protein